MEVEKKVYDVIREYELKTLAIYLHSWQGENYTVEEIIELLNTKVSEFRID